MLGFHPREIGSIPICRSKMKNVKFEVMPQSWHKRRQLTVVPPTVTSVEVIGYQQIQHHLCEIEATFDDGNKVTLQSKVNYSYINGANGQRFHERWTIQGLNSDGISVLLQVVEK